MNQTPFVTKKIAAGYMIRRGNKWLTPESTWSFSIFEGAAFETKSQAEWFLNKIKKGEIIVVEEIETLRGPSH